MPQRHGCSQERAIGAPREQQPTSGTDSPETPSTVWEGMEAAKSHHRVGLTIGGWGGVELQPVSLIFTLPKSMRTVGAVLGSTSCHCSLPMVGKI